jgi:chromosome segregation protein
MSGSDELPDVPAGAQWRRVDLHLHTPAVHSFRLSDGTDLSSQTARGELVDRYVQRLADAHIDVAAITDYQGVRADWFEAIRHRAADRGITVLPGAEMSVGQGAGKGVHILLVCSGDTSLEKINAALQHEDRDGGALFSERQQHRDIRLRGTLAETLQHLRHRLDCVVVAAHAGDNNGMIRELGATHTAELVRDGLVDAIDLCDTAPHKLQSTGVLSVERVENLACTQSSDPKSLEEIGNRTLADGRPRATWLKLSAVDSAALRLALHDPTTRLLNRAPMPPAHVRVLAMDVDGSGFLSGLQVRWNDDLSALIGGRGAGKSAILETLRYVLDATPFSDASERESLVRHALGSGGRVRVVIERPGPQDGECYEITRVLGQQPRVISRRTGTHLDVRPLDVFGPGGRPMILLQREIQTVSRDGAFRLRLLNEIIGDDAGRADARIRRITEELRSNARRIAEVDERLAKKEEYESQLARLETEIAYYEEQGVADKLSRHSRLGIDGTILDESGERIAATAQEQEAAARDTSDSLQAVADRLRGGSSEHAQILVETAARVDAARSRIDHLNAGIRSELNDVEAHLADGRSRWSGLVEPLAEELRQLQAQLQTDRLDPGRFIAASRERTALRPLVDAIAQHQRSRDKLVSERRDLLRRLQDERRAAHRMRQQAAAQVNTRLEGKLAIEVGYLGATERFHNELASVLRGSRVNNEALDAIVAAGGVDGVELSKAAAEGELAVRQRFGISVANAQRLVTWLTAEPDRLPALEVMAPTDLVDIALEVDGSSRSLDRLSSGQRATALLLLLFAQPGRPLILDQPEDDLDNRFVYDDVVALLRHEKGVADVSRRRQLIAATHNANIPVNGDAELVLSLAAEGGRCCVLTRASIDDRHVRTEIRSVLEGGADAFRRRAEKYGGVDDA